MTNIRIEMNYYICAKQYVVIVLYDDAEGVLSSLNWYFKSHNKAARHTAMLEQQYQVKGIINE